MLSTRQSRLLATKQLLLIPEEAGFQHSQPSGFTPTTGSAFGQPSFGQPAPAVSAPATASVFLNLASAAPTSLLGRPSAFGVLSRNKFQSSNCNSNYSLTILPQTCMNYLHDCCGRQRYPRLKSNATSPPKTPMYVFFLSFFSYATNDC